MADNNQSIYAEVTIDPLNGDWVQDFSLYDILTIYNNRVYYYILLGKIPSII